MVWNRIEAWGREWTGFNLKTTMHPGQIVVGAKGNRCKQSGAHAAQLMPGRAAQTSTTSMARTRLCRVHVQHPLRPSLSTTANVYE